MSMGHHEVLGNILVRRLIPPQTLTSATLNTYDALALGAGVDQWHDGSAATKFQWQKGVIVVNVGSMTATSLTCSLYDDGSALTAANGDTNATKCFDLTAITAAGLYLCEFSFGHVFDSSYARVVADSDADRVQRYLSLRCVAAGGNAVFGAELILGGCLGGFPTNGSLLTATWVSA